MSDMKTGLRPQTDHFYTASAAPDRLILEMRLPPLSSHVSMQKKMKPMESDSSIEQGSAYCISLQITVIVDFIIIL